MKIIFNQIFKEKLLDTNNLYITSYSIFNTKDVLINNLKDLFSIEFINSITRKTSNTKLYSLYDNEKFNLKLNLKISEEDKEFISEFESNLIYCYYTDEINVENIAFILCDPNKVSENLYDLYDLNLDSSRNLIEIYFPTNTKSNIITNLEDDTEFLEGGGTYKNCSIYNILENNELFSNRLIGKNSFLKYITELESNPKNKNSVPYLDKNTGKRIISNPTNYIKVNKISLYTDNSILNIGILTDNTLSQEGGSIRLKGEFEFNRITYFDNKIISEEQKTSNLNSLTNFEIIIINNNGLKLELDKNNFIINYLNNDFPEQTKYCDILIRYYYLNPETNEVTTIDSNSLRLSQGKEVLDWNIISKTPFSEDNIKLYLFSSRKNEVQFFDIYTTKSILDEEISITSENDTALKTFFNIYYEKNYKNNSIRVYIRTVLNNNTENWNPIVNGESTLILCKIQTLTRYETFYCVQGVASSFLKLYKNFTNFFSKIISINLSEDERAVELAIAAKNPENNKWRVISYDESLEIIPKLGIINNEDSLSNIESIDKFIVKSNKSIESTENIEFFPIIFENYIENEEDNPSLNDWRNSINLDKLIIPVILKGEDPELNIDISDIYLTNLGLYKVIVKSNCPFVAKFTPGDSTNSFNKLKFIDNNTEIISEDFNNINGIPIYFSNYIVDYLSENETPLELDNLVIETYNQDNYNINKTIRIFQEQLKAISEKINPITSFIFNNNYTGDIKVNCNKSVIISSNSNTNLSQETILDKDYCNINNGYLYTKIDYIINSGKYFYPIDLIDTITIVPSGLYDKNLELVYKIYLLGVSPNITILDESYLSKIIYLPNTSNSSIEFNISSNYELNRDNFDIIFENTKYKFKYELEKISSDEIYSESIIYKIKITSLQNNLQNVDRLLGNLIITSKILKNNFLINSEENNEVLNEIDQEFIDNLVGVFKLNFTIYQEKLKDIHPEIQGDLTFIKSEGEERIFNLINNDNNEFEVTYQNRDNFVNVNKIDNDFKIKIDNILDNSKFVYLPINYTEFDYSNNEFVKDRFIEILFTLSEKKGNRSYVERLNLIQKGYSGGIIYNSANYNKMLFLGNKEINYITEAVDNNITEFKFGIGFKDFKVNNNVTDYVKIESSNNINNYQIIYNNRYNIDENNNNVSIIFSENLSNEDIHMNLVITYLDNFYTEHKLNLKIIQRKKNYYFNTTLTNNQKILIHSIGLCNLYPSELGKLCEINTDIPIELLELKSSIETINYEIINLSKNNYKILFSTLPNTSNYIINGNLIIGYNFNNKFIILWEGSTKQGYCTAELIDNNSNIIKPNESFGSIENPIEIPKDKIESNNLKYIYKINLKRVEVGEIENNNIEVLPENCKLGESLEYKPSWEILDNLLDINEMFDKFETNLNLPTETINKPFIEHLYNCSLDGISLEFVLKISINLFINYSDLNNETTPNIPFNFFFKKII